MRLKTRADTKFNDIRKFSVIREETEESLSGGSSSPHDGETSDMDYKYNATTNIIPNGDINGFPIGHDADPEYSQEDTLSKTNYIGSSDEEEDVTPARDRETTPVSDYSEQQQDFQYFDFSSDDTRSDYEELDYTAPVLTKKKTYRTKKKKVQPKENKPSYVRNRTKKINKVAPQINKDKSDSSDRNTKRDVKVSKKNKPVKRDRK